MNNSHKLAVLILVLVLIALAFSACAAPAPTPAPIPTATATDLPRITPLATLTPVPAGANAETIMSANCVGCHTLERVVNAKKTRDEWDQTVTKMIRLSASDQKVLVDYLAATYKR
jgi:mono/diheme cytochrome c family protein